MAGAENTTQIQTQFLIPDNDKIKFLKDGDDNKCELKYKLYLKIQNTRITTLQYKRRMIKPFTDDKEMMKGKHSLEEIDNIKDREKIWSFKNLQSFIFHNV